MTLKTGKALGQRSIETIIKQCCREAELRGVSVRTLRHTFAVHFLARGTTIEVIQKALDLATSTGLEDDLDAARALIDAAFGVQRYYE